MLANFGNSAVATGVGKVFIRTQKKGNAKECWNVCTIVLISHASKVMLKILQVGFNSIWSKSFQMYKLDLRKAEKAGIKLPTMLDHRKSKRIPEKTSTAASLTRVKPLNVDHNKLKNS